LHKIVYILTNTHPGNRNRRFSGVAQ
jgi:hypothetical protein